MRRSISALFAVFAVSALGGLSGCGHKQPPPPPSTTTTTIPATPPPPMAAPPHVPVAVFGDGKYEVLVDILPGEYKATGNGGTGKCYWARLKDFSGAVTSTIAMQYGNSGPDVATIEPSDKGFETRNCGTWTRVTPR